MISWRRRPLRRWRGCRCRSGAVLVIRQIFRRLSGRTESPETERTVNDFRGLLAGAADLARAAPQARPVERPVAANSAFHMARERLAAGNRFFVLRLDCLIGDQLAIAIQPHSRWLIGHCQSMPLAIADIAAGAYVVGLHAGQVGGELSAARHGKHFPVGARLLRIASHENVVAALAVEPGPTFHGYRRRAILGSAFSEPAAWRYSR